MNRKISLFNPWAERLNICLPFVVAPLVCWDLFVGLSATADTKFYFRCLSAYLFFNATHNAFTFVILFLFPEGRQWIAQDLGGSFWARKAIVLAVIVGAALGGSAIYYSLVSGPALRFLAFLGILFPMTHTFAQMRGFSSMYNQATKHRFRLYPAIISKIRAVEKVERTLFQIVLALLVYQCVVMWKGYPTHAPTYLIAATIPLIIINSLRYPRRGESNKIPYLLRLLYFPLASLSWTAIFAIRTFHGVEYLLLFRKMKSRTSAKDSVLLSATLLVPLTFTVGLLNSSFLVSRFGKFDIYSTLLPVLVPIHYAVEFGHYILDGIIFRFRAKSVQKCFSPLISLRDEAQERAVQGCGVHMEIPDSSEPVNLDPRGFQSPYLPSKSFGLDNSG